MGTNDYDRELYTERSMIERSINRLKRHRRIATRYEKLAATDLAMATIACMLNGSSFANRPYSGVIDDVQRVA